MMPLLTIISKLLKCCWIMKISKLIFRKGIANTNIYFFYLVRLQESFAISNKDCDGNTPLHYSTREENKKLIELLLEHDANPIIRNKQGELPGDLAINPKIIRMLQKAVDEKNERLSQRSMLNVSKSSCLIKEKTLFEGEALCLVHSSMNDGKKVGANNK